MPSAIDPTVPPTGAPVTSAPIRSNFAYAASEIGAIQAIVMPVPAGLVSANGATLGSVALGSGLELTGAFPNQVLNVTGTVTPPPSTSGGAVAGVGGGAVAGVGGGAEAGVGGATTAALMEKITALEARLAALEGKG